jgi:cytoskeletal protein CcmA (bactofilin family)
MLTLTHRSGVERPRGRTAHDEAEAPPSFLGPGAGIQGALETKGELVVSGRVRGHITALRLVIAVDGFVEGDIIAREVVIGGRLNGRVFAPKVSVEASAEIEGRIFHTNVTIARGARVAGRMPWRPISFFETLEQLPEIRP